MLLVDYDDEHYIFNDPLRNKNTYYRKSAVEAAYAGLFKQAIVIINKAQGIDPEVTKYICEQKVKEVLSAFSASDINLIGKEIVLEKSFPALRSPNLNIDVIASVGHNFIPLGTKAVYNVKDGKISLESEGLGLFLKPEVALPFYDFNNNGVSLRDIALKMTTGTIAVTVTNVEPTDTGNIIQIAYTLYMPEVKLPNSQSVELTMNVLYTIIQNRSEPPVSEAEKALNDNIEEMQRKFNQNIQIDWSAVGSFFIPTSQATAATFWGSLGAAFLTFAPFYYYYDYEEEIELAFE